jgi:peptide/nickel transport system permease protein
VAALILRRLLSLIPLLLIVSFGVFMLVALVPGDASVTLAGGESATPERIAEVRSQLHLDEPVMEQYGRWLSGAVHGDFGSSLFTKVPVSEDILDRVPITLGLVLAALVVGLVIGVPVGVISALRPGRAVDGAARVGTSVALAVPNYWLAIELVVLFAVTWKLLPPSGYVKFTDNPLEWLRHIALPAVALGLWSAASLARQLRASLIDVLDSRYVRTAWAKGAGTGRVVMKHAMKNAAIPVVTVLGLQIGFLLGGTVIIEQIFSIPGLGPYFIRAVTSLDVPVIQGVAIVFVLFTVFLSLLVDISYGLLDPRVRVE